MVTDPLSNSYHLIGLAHYGCFNLVTHNPKNPTSTMPTYWAQAYASLTILLIVYS